MLNVWGRWDRHHWYHSLSHICLSPEDKVHHQEVFYILWIDSKSLVRAIVFSFMWFFKCLILLRDPAENLHVFKRIGDDRWDFNASFFHLIFISLEFFFSPVYFRTSRLNVNSWPSYWAVTEDIFLASAGFPTGQCPLVIMLLKSK